jgi:hypothetical protein
MVADKGNEEHTISLNVLLLLLVMLGGFLGNMLYIASSFTAFVGARKFLRSWYLWYFVKPFTGSGLALVLYFAFRARFMNYGNDAGNINLYGVMSLAILAGMFTDIATQKLREIFMIAFKLKEDLPDRIDTNAPVVDTVEPDKIDPAKENAVLIKGKRLTVKPLVVSVNGTTIDPDETKPESITFKYKVDPIPPVPTDFHLVVKDKDGHIFIDKKL